MWVAGTPVPMPSPATSQQAVISKKHSTEKGRASPSGSGPANRGSPVMECQPQLPWASERLSLLGTASTRPVVLCRAAPQQPAPPGPSLLSAITAARGGLTELRLRGGGSLHILFAGSGLAGARPQPVPSPAPLPPILPRAASALCSASSSWPFPSAIFPGVRSAVGRVARPTRQDSSCPRISCPEHAGAS